MRLLLTLLFWGLWLLPSQAQDSTVVLNTSMFSNNGQINLSASPGWVYHPNHNPAWASADLNTTGWVQHAPSTLTVKEADQNGRVEGWFRLRILLDSSFTDVPLGICNDVWAAADVYLDGRRVVSFGNTGANAQPYREHFPYFQLPVSVYIKSGQEHLLAVHVVDRVSLFRHYPGPKLLSELNSGTNRLMMLTSPQYAFILLNTVKERSGYTTLWAAISVFLAFYFWMLSTQNLPEKKTIRLLALHSTFFAFANLCRFNILNETSFTLYWLCRYGIGLGLWLTSAFATVILLVIWEYPVSRRLAIGLILIALVGFLLDEYIGNDIVISIANLLQQILLVYLFVSCRKRLKGAKWAIVIGGTIAIAFSALFAICQLTQTLYNFALVYSGVALAVPISFSAYIALRFREILAEDLAKAASIMKITQEKNNLLATQNERLEQQVEARTAELKASQAQLIQKEKLASLGELTAGIAHEIQNPLNFVNNFSEVSTELLEELREGPFAKLPEEEKEYSEEILGDLSSNLHKIHHHGGRAASIVRGMLEHSRTEPGEKRPTDLNALAQEYLNIAYHGLRAKDKDVNAELVTDFTPDLDRIVVAPQEIGRVLLNLYNNAFYAVSERTKQTSDPDHKSIVEVHTQRQGDQIVIRVRDNGTGIPDALKAKIFQPFFTTKPTGEGTGLGLSLSYDIITKGHGGTLTLESQEGEGTTFTISLPIANQI